MTAGNLTKTQKKTKGRARSASNQTVTSKQTRPELLGKLRSNNTVFSCL